MVEGGGGSIVNISSTAGAMGFRGMTAYSAAKGGLAALTRSIAADYGRFNIRCNTIVLGFIVSNDEARQMIAIPEYRDLMTDGTMLPQFGETDDVAEAAIFLASERAKYITGASLAVDGGLLINARVPNLDEVSAALLAAFAEQG
jgi:3-oxoacyl-[acyl-carrier protein] reductase